MTTKQPVGGPRSRSTNDPRLSREQILDLLRDAPGRIDAATRDLDERALASSPAPDAWSMVVILAHLRACDDVWGGAILRILAEARPTIRVVSPRTWVRTTGYPEQPFLTSLQAYTHQRRALLATLEPVPASAWDRTAIVTGAGAVMERTLTWYALGLAAHERSHVWHIERLTRR